MRVLTGKVISAKMQDTVVVSVDRMVPHAKYGKKMRRTSKFAAHTDKPVKIGDIVQIGEVKPISKTVTFKVL